MRDSFVTAVKGFDITEDPKFTNYHADREYLAGIGGSKEPVFLNVHYEGVSIPLFKRPLEADLFDLFSPIGFQPYIDTSLWPDLLEAIKEEFKGTGIVSIYILGRNDLSHITPPYGFDLSLYRTNYYIDLGLSDEEWLDRMKRDSRQRLIKALRVIRYRMERGVVSEGFIRNYSRIAEAKRFPPRYLLSESDFMRLGSANGMVYLELRDDRTDDFIAGGFFGCHRDDVDYLFGADDQRYRDAIRLLIDGARRHFKKQGFKRLYLGGGVREGDSLAQFKQRMGTEGHRCTAVRGIIDIEEAERLYGGRFSKEWFSGFFPPYVRRGDEE